MIMTMSGLAALYASLILAALYTCGYSIWCYYECPATRSHRPYILPIFISVGWFFFGIDGLLAIATHTTEQADSKAVLLLSVSTLVALFVFVYHYRRSRRSCHEAVREAHPVHPPTR